MGADEKPTTFMELEAAFIASLNADNLSPKCHWTTLRRHWHPVMSLVDGGRADDAEEALNG